MPQTNCINDNKVHSAMEGTMKIFDSLALSPTQALATLVGVCATVIKLLQDINPDYIQRQDEMIADFAESIRLNLERLKSNDAPEA